MKNYITPICHFIKKNLLDLESILIFFYQKYTHKKNDKIRVVFMTQYVSSWNKMEPIYERLVNDPRFEVFLLCLPIEITDCQLDPSVKSNGTFTYFSNKGYSNIINAMLENGKWYDLKQINPDYLFCSRPYNNYLPKEYSSRNFSRFTKICLVLYGINLSKRTLGTCINWRFCSDIRIFFSERDFVTKYYLKQYHIKTKLKLQSVVTTGAPVLESIIQRKNEQITAWEFSHNPFRIIWTPRWTTDSNVGGSNFFKYKDFLISFAKNNTDLDILFRPHPLALDHFVRTGEMTSQDVQKFKDICNTTKNISLDTTKEYIGTFWQSSVLISDYSSILPEYFITGKPIIFCEANIDWGLEDFAQKMFDAFYIARCEDDIKKYIQEIKNGNDYLKEKRQQVIAGIFGEDFSVPSRKIVEYLLDDYQKNN